MPDVEFRSSLKRDKVVSFKPNWLTRSEQAWQFQRSIESAVDLLDAALLSNKHDLAFEAAAFLVGQPKKVADRVLLAATHIMSNRPIAVYQHGLEAVSSNASTEVIRRLKERLRIHDRDPVTAVELARLYTRRGQLESANRAMNVAITLAPNDRFILRSATRLLTMTDQGERALNLLRRAEGAVSDPWLQSAEIATSELNNKGSKFANSALRRIKSADKLPQSMSELALALATLEYKSGAKARNTFQMIRAGLNHTTENALTQAVWLTDNMGSMFAERFPEFLLPNEAHEARALETFEQGAFIESERECALWVGDQPFQSRGPSLLATINIVHLGRYDVAAIVAENAMQLHPLDWEIANSAVVARALNNQVEQAKTNLHRLKGLCKSEVSQIFLAAAQGLVSFKAGDVESGREHYTRAFAIARRAKRPDLVSVAAMYYAEAEAQAGRASEEEVINFVRKIDEIVSTKFKNPKNEIPKVWEARRKIVDKYLVDRFNSQLALSKTSSDVLAEFPLLQN